MEGFDLISTGAWSIIPPILALGLALLTKEVYSSLTVGVFSGMLIYQFTLNGAGAQQVVDSVVMVPQMMAEQIGGNGGLILFMCLLGALTVVIAVAGGSRAYAEWVTKHVKSARAALVLTTLLGIFIFVDDYFNCLTVGAVMRPVTDRCKISREKLSWIIDSMAAPICIIAPVSSWAVAVAGYLGDDGFNNFVASIPYNFYALLTIFFVFFICITKIDFGPMAKAEAVSQGLVREIKIPGKGTVLEAASSKGVGITPEELDKENPDLPTFVAELDEVEATAQKDLKEYMGIPISERGKVFDLVVPILVLVIFSILGMLYVGGYFSGTEFSEALGESPTDGLCIGAFVALIIALIMFLPRKLMNLDIFVQGVSEGVRSMVGAIMILVLAWSLGGCCRYMLGTGEFVATFLNNIGASLEILPVCLFLVSAAIGFAMGTSWGTIALIVPIVVGVYDASDPLFLVAVGATLAGAVYGDHVSPISDTTILSSTGAQCNHLRHVATQIPYATTVMVVCVLCYVIAGLTANPWLALGIGAVVIAVAVLCFNKINGIKKVTQSAAAQASAN